jgi:hypothetical protein
MKIPQKRKTQEKTHLQGIHEPSQYAVKYERRSFSPSQETGHNH